MYFNFPQVYNVNNQKQNFSPNYTQNIPPNTRKVSFDSNIRTQTYDDNVNRHAGESTPLVKKSINIETTYNYTEEQTQTDRSNLIVKIFGVLAVQFFITAIVSFGIYTNQKFVIVDKNYWTLILLSFLCSATIIIIYRHNINNTKQLKLFLAFLLAIPLGLLVGIIVVCYGMSVILHSIITTFLTTMCCVLFVYITKIDLHSWKGKLNTCLSIFLSVIIASLFLPTDNSVHLICSIFGTILFVAFLLYDTSDAILNEKNNMDYIDISMSIYLDIINLFINVTDIVGQIFFRPASTAITNTNTNLNGVELQI